MKNLKTFSIVIALFAFAAIACNYSTANLSSLTTSKDKEGKQESSAFKTGDTLFAKANVANNGGKVKVKLYLVADDVKGMTKGETLKGSDVTLDIDGDGFAEYNVPVTTGFLPGTYTLNADMINEAGEKKDNKTAKVTVAGAPADAPATEPDTESNSADDSEN